jgi:outer membrane protein OmpA-like peptidoglycan-associated protein
VPRRSVLTASLLAGLAAALLVACGGQSKPKTPTGGGSGGIPTVTAQVVKPSTTTAPTPPDAPCGSGQGKTIPAVDIPAVHVPGARAAGGKIGGDTFPAVVVPPITIPAQHIPAQCARVSPAPAGCLGAVHIPAVAVPGAVVPGLRIAKVSAGGVTAPGRTIPPMTRPPVSRDGASQPADCQQKARPGQTVLAVTRLPATRLPATRLPTTRDAVSRESACDSSNHCIPALNLPAVTAPGATVPGVTVAGQTIVGRTLPEIRSSCVKVAQGGGQTDYAVCTDVLFAFGKSALRPQAQQVLLQVAGSIRQRFPRGRIQVDGFTDSKGSPAFNQGLSDRRAAAVKAFLAAHGVAAARMTTRGYGETHPVAPNTKPGGADNPAGRAKNRRVVVGVMKP